MSGGKAVPGETSQFALNKMADVWQIVPTRSMTLTNASPGSSLCLSWASCLITLAAGENHEKSKEWAQTGAGSRSESCNHVWWLIVWSEECHCEGSRCVGHICLKYPLITQPGLPYLAAVAVFSFHMYDLQVFRVDPLIAARDVWTAGCVSAHAVSVGGSYLLRIILQHDNCSSLTSCRHSYRHILRLCRENSKS